jgi:hypothetical protein
VVSGLTLLPGLSLGSVMLDEWQDLELILLEKATGISKVDAHRAQVLHHATTTTTNATRTCTNTRVLGWFMAGVGYCQDQ